MDPRQPWQEAGAEQIKGQGRDGICLLDPILKELSMKGRIKLFGEAQSLARPEGIYIRRIAAQAC